jgi:hypothetical protein
MSSGNVRQQFIQTRAWTTRIDQAAAKLAVGIGEFKNIKNTQITTSTGFGNYDFDKDDGQIAVIIR